MATKKVEKGGVYRHQDGTAVYLAEGARVEEALLGSLTHDAGATEQRAVEREPAFRLGVTDAPQSQKAEDTYSGRMVSGAPENKAMGRASGQKSDGELADDAAKGKGK